jgi:hypothetical protein
LTLDYDGSLGALDSWTIDWGNGSQVVPDDRTNTYYREATKSLNLAAIDQIMAEWTSGTAYDDRDAALERLNVL